jgi:hypothetical protein
MPCRSRPWAGYRIRARTTSPPIRTSATMRSASPTAMSSCSRARSASRSPLALTARPRARRARRAGGRVAGGGLASRRGARPAQGCSGRTRCTWRAPCRRCTAAPLRLVGRALPRVAPGVPPALTSSGRSPGRLPPGRAARGRTARGPGCASPGSGPGLSRCQPRNEPGVRGLLAAAVPARSLAGLQVRGCGRCWRPCARARLAGLEPVRPGAVLVGVGAQDRVGGGVGLGRARHR